MAKISRPAAQREKAGYRHRPDARKLLDPFVILAFDGGFNNLTRRFNGGDFSVGGSTPRVHDVPKLNPATVPSNGKHEFAEQESADRSSPGIYRRQFEQQIWVGPTMSKLPSCEDRDLWA